MAQYKEQFERDGYILIKDVFSQEEVESFREGCRLNAEGDALCRPQFQNVPLSPKVVSVVKDLLGEDISYPALTVTWTRKGYHKVPRGFHSDFVGIDDMQGEYPIINVAVYLQDYSKASDGLKVIPGSHTRPCVSVHNFREAIKSLLKGNWGFDFSHSVNIPSTERDLVIWYMRTHHSGRYKRLKWFPTLSLSPLFENLLPSWMCMPVPAERDAVVMKFARSGQVFDEYLKRQTAKTRRSEHYRNNACLETEEKKELARRVGVTLRNDGYHTLSETA